MGWIEANCDPVAVFTRGEESADLEIGDGRFFIRVYRARR
jgi:hypothetical protein